MALEVKTENNKIFAPLKNKWLVASPEEMVRQEYICRLVNHYGFQLDQMQQEVTVAEGNQRGTGRASADIVVWKSKAEVEKVAPIIVVECKADNINISEGDYFQGSHYARYVKAPFFVTTNLKHTKVFKVNLEGYPKDLEDEILDIPSAKDLGNEKRIKDLLTQTKAFTRDEFSNLLFRCHNIIRNNDKLSPEAAFDETSKILFMKIRYERNPDEDNIFTLKQFQKQEKHYEKNIRPVNVKLQGTNMDIPYMDYWFELTKAEFKNDDLFDDNEKIKIKQASFEAIVKALEIYNLSTTSDDVKGIAFEKFLGKTFRGELGQFFTPRTVVNFMVEVLDPQEGEVICDPCCGSGGFLIKAFEYVRSKIEQEIFEEKEKIKTELFDEAYLKATEKEKERIEEAANLRFAILNAELDINNPNSRIRRLSYDCIYGTDANPRMARTSKMNMIMHGDGHGGVHHHDGLLNVNGIFEERFDVILTNPPFGARVEKSLKITETDKFTDEAKIKYYTERYGNDYLKALRQVNDNINKPILDLYDVGKLSGLTEVLFIERCFRLLAKGGRMAIVLPEGVLNNTNLQQVRDFFESKAKIILITSIPQDVFIASGATVKPSLLFFKKFTEEEEKQYKKIHKEADKTIKEKYQVQITELETFIAERSNLTSDKKEKRSELAALEKQMQDEIKTLVKEKFDYQIPIAEVEKAGITTTGAECENELEQLAVEFKEYRKKTNIWKEKLLNITYAQGETGFFRYVLGEPQEIYAKQ
jgi:type I restriction enzyme M protein